jgi:hypothetical protein
MVEMSTPKGQYAGKAKPNEGIRLTAKHLKTRRLAEKYRLCPVHFP